MIGLGGANQVMYRGSETINMQEVKEAIRALGNKIAVGLNKVTLKMTKHERDCANGFKKMCNGAFESRTILWRYIKNGKN